MQQESLVNASQSLYWDKMEKNEQIKDLINEKIIKTNSE